jgi:hypothetical protein
VNSSAAPRSFLKLGNTQLEVKKSRYLLDFCRSKLCTSHNISTPPQCIFKMAIVGLVPLFTEKRKLQFKMALSSVKNGWKLPPHFKTQQTKTDQEFFQTKQKIKEMLNNSANT